MPEQNGQQEDGATSPTTEEAVPDPPDPGQTHREKLNKTRLEAFSDGVFAIAITLLVLELNVNGGLSHEKFIQALRHLGPKLEAYALSFVIVGVYWVAHNLMFHAVRFADRTLLWINNFFLLFVASIPFAAALLGQYPNEPLAAAIYGGNLFCSSSMLFTLWRYATWDYRLIERGISPILINGGLLRTGVSLVMYASAMGLAFVDTRISLTIYWLAPLAFAILQGIIDRRARWSKSHVKALAGKTAPSQPPSHTNPSSTYTEKNLEKKPEEPSVSPEKDSSDISLKTPKK